MKFDPSEPRHQFQRGAYSRSGSVFNVVMCSVVLVGGLAWFLLPAGPPWPFMIAWLAIGSFLEFTFVRIMVRAHRGDYDKYRDLG